MAKKINSKITPEVAPKKSKKEIEVIDMHGAKTVAKKTSFITRVKRIFSVFAIVWIAVFAITPLYVKKHYEQPIKKSIVVGMFFDLQRQISEQYEAMLDLIKDNINLEKPINAAIDKLKVAESAAEGVQEKTAKANAAAQKVGGIAARFGVKSSGLDSATGAIAKADGAANLVNDKLDKIKGDLAKTAQLEVDKMVDEQIKKVADKGLGGLGSTLLTNYGIKHVYPWRPSSWGVASKIYADLERSSSGTVASLMGMVNTYFGYVAWGLVIIVWLVGFIGLMYIKGKVKLITSPFIVCPRCGHTFADKRTALGILKVFQPWKWI